MKLLLLRIIVMIIIPFAFLTCKSNQSTSQVIARDEYKIWSLLSAEDYKNKLDSTQLPYQFQLLNLNMVRAKSRLKEIEPYIATQNEVRFDDPSAKTANIQLPWDDGLFQTYILKNSSMLTPDLAKKFPNIRSYSGYQQNNPAIHVRVDINPKGFFAMITAPEKTIFVKPYIGIEDLYLCFDKKQAEHLNKEFYEPPISPPPSDHK